MAARVAAKARRRPNRRIVIGAPDLEHLAMNALPLIDHLIAAGHDVLCLAAQASEADEATLLEHGAATEEVSLQADRMALMPARQVSQRVARSLQSFDADTIIVHRPEVAGAMLAAGQRAGLERRIAVYEGLDAAGTPQKAPAGPTEQALIPAFDAATDLICHNYDHAAVLETSGILPEGLSPLVLPAFGVALDLNPVVELPGVGRGLSFLALGALTRQQGILDYCEAAKRLKERAPQAEFLLAGAPPQSGPSLSVKDIEPYREAVQYLGDGRDMAKSIGRCHVFVHTAHDASVPDGALHALSMGRPLIASDAAGSRELVDERVNGCLFKPGDPASLVSAMESFLKRPDLIPAMARASRQKAERRYDRRLVLAAYDDVLGLQPISARA